MTPTPAIGSFLPQTKRSRLRAARFRVSSCRSLPYASSTMITRYGGSQELLQELLQESMRPEYPSHPIWGASTAGCHAAPADSRGERNAASGTTDADHLE